jgi:hypothetical protein
MKEQNQNNLKSALGKLPEYEPPDTVWQGIETRLPLLELPTYDAPDFVWQQIEEQLNSPQNRNRKTEIRNTQRGGQFYRWAIAASIVLVVSVGFWFLKTQNTEQINISISTEVVDNQLLKKDFDNEEHAFAMVETFCKTALPVCEQPEFKNLKNELDTLNTAREELKNALGEYAADPDLIAELTKIENERTSVLRQLVEKIN